MVIPFKVLLFTSLVGLLLTACGRPINAPVALHLPQPVPLVQPTHSPVSLVLRFVPGTSRNQRALLLAEYNLHLLQIEDDLYRVMTPPNAPLHLLAQLKADPRLSMVDSAASWLQKPDFSLSSQPSPFLKLLGKVVELEGIYHTHAAGASLILAEGDTLDLVNPQGLPLQHLPHVEDRCQVRIRGWIRHGVTPSHVGLFPQHYQRI